MIKNLKKGSKVKLLYSSEYINQAIDKNTDTRLIGIIETEITLLIIKNNEWVYVRWSNDYTNTYKILDLEEWREGLKTDIEDEILTLINKIENGPQ